jgi:hypothetical protein
MENKMNLVNISRKTFHSWKVQSVSANFDEVHKAEKMSAPEGVWRTPKRSAHTDEFVILEYSAPQYIDLIELTPSASSPAAFPKALRFEVSMDLKEWKVLHSERNISLKNKPYILDLPLTYTKYLKIYIYDTADSGGSFFSEIASCVTGLSGIASVVSENPSVTGSEPDKLISGTGREFWETEHTQASRKESLLIDLGKIFSVSRVVIGSADRLFPEHFSIELSEDKGVWTTAVDEKRFHSEPLKTYYWDIDTVPARYIRLEARSVKNSDAKYGLRISSLSVSAAAFCFDHLHNTGPQTPSASIFKSGIVRLARDGEEAIGVAVQASDMRLRDAGTIFKGIARLAEEGEENPGCALQASDPRIKPATELKPGIVKLAYDREINAGSVVQSNDSRLQHADDSRYGIVKLCPDGIYAENTAVTGNDSRLKRSTEENPGIVRLAKDGGTDPETAVQANDSRLRDADTGRKGIVELAADGERKPGAAVQSDDRRLKDATTMNKGIVELAEDGEETAGLAVQANDRRLKDATAKLKGIVELAEDGEDKPLTAVQGSDRRLKEATTTTKGIVELAEDGEASAGVAVQGNDRRLKEASTVSKGIIRLADDGETNPGSAVQGSDKRLKEATTITKGIIELAEDGEDSAGVAVQGNDRRLKEATTVTKGIVELAEDGEDFSGVAVQGNDRRLKEATTVTKGIVELAEDGETSAGVAVQGNDRRLKEATTVTKGIVELAEDGEDISGVAVQGNDRRLKEATTVTKGIVELADDGESTAGLAVQGNDRRLKPADEERHGIVRLAKNNEIRKGYAVQSDDDRLSDKRDPLSHTHEYAPLKHDFDSHTGAINVTAEKNTEFFEITAPPSGASVIRGENSSPGAGSIGVAGISGAVSEKGRGSYGVLGHSRHIGVRGQASGTGEEPGAGVLGIARFGAGGVFASEHGYSLVAEGFGRVQNFDGTVNLNGSGEALLVNGSSQFDGRVNITNNAADSLFPANIVEYFEVDDDEFLSPGDLLVVSDKGGSLLSKSRKPFSKGVIGVISGNPTLVINNSGKEQKIYPVVLAGKAMCKVDARKTPVAPGDFIVTSDTAGCGMRGSIDDFAKIGTVIGKALDSIAEGIGTIPVFIAHL